MRVTVNWTDVPGCSSLIVRCHSSFLAFHALNFGLQGMEPRQLFHETWNYKADRACAFIRSLTLLPKGSNASIVKCSKSALSKNSGDAFFRSRIN